MKYTIGIALCLAGLTAPAQPEDIDPVVRARAHRAIRDSQDLPPIPRGLTEPPPLPPPELHTHDIRRHRRSAAKSRKARPAQKGGQAQAKAAPPKTAAKKAGQAPAKAQSGKRQAGQAKKG
jgi:hypothetical protein